MAKKISCQVVRSVSLSKSGDALLHAYQSNNNLHKIDDVIAVSVRARHTHNPVTYTARLDITRVSIDNSPTGRTLDCYA